MKHTWLALCVAISLLIGCTPAAPASAPAPTAQAGKPAAARFGPKFQALLDKAKQADGHIRAGLSAYTPEFIRAMEKQFGEEFGINITLANDPGHASRETQPQILQANT